jgi:hypothetical protein
MLYPKNMNINNEYAQLNFEEVKPLNNVKICDKFEKNNSDNNDINLSQKNKIDKTNKFLKTEIIKFKMDIDEDNDKNEINDILN